MDFDSNSKIVYCLLLWAKQTCLSWVAMCTLTLARSSPHTAGKYLLWCLQHLLVLFFSAFLLLFLIIFLLILPVFSCCFLNIFSQRCNPFGWWADLCPLWVHQETSWDCVYHDVAAYLPPTETLTSIPSKVG